MIIIILRQTRFFSFQFNNFSHITGLIQEIVMPYVIKNKYAIDDINDAKEKDNQRYTYYILIFILRAFEYILW